LNPDENAPESATALVGNMKILIPLAGLIDKQAELDRLNKEIGKISGEIKRLEGKLGNPNFVDKAPKAVVAKERDKLAAAQEAFSHLNGQLEKITAL
jgi:valyl-tRNA synthetase